MSMRTGGAPGGRALPVILLLAFRVQAAVVLGTSAVQGSFQIDDDPATTNLDIFCRVTWENLSDYVDANNQIAANGTFGTNDGLVGVSTTDFEHFFDPPTYALSSNSFNIAYASGVVNTPGNTDTFKFRFMLPTDNAALAQAAVDELNARVLGGALADPAYSRAASINGIVDGGATPDPFENSPVVYVPDVWADPDGDGFTSWDEFTAATSPTNAADFPSIGTASNGIAFATAAGRVYTVEGCADLVGTAVLSRPSAEGAAEWGHSALPQWQTVTNLPGTGAPVALPFGTNRFYRLRITLP
ncbi:hypothetical protein P4B35_14115 [Pontiellaceae bacterium B12227]|nr:hypothetical protein [Pontiellaceae bacterium B12227]